MTDLLHRCVKSDYILSVSHHSLIILRKEQSCIQFQVPTALLTFSMCLSVCLHIYTLVCLWLWGACWVCRGLWHKASTFRGHALDDSSTESQNCQGTSCLTKYPQCFLEYQRIWINIASFVLVGFFFPSPSFCCF